VELQIRKKKDRRRLIFWIPFLALLLGGGLWLGIDHYTNAVVYHETRNNSQQQDQITSSENKQKITQAITTNEKANKKSVDKNVLEQKKEVINKSEVSKTANRNDVELIDKIHDSQNKDVKTKRAFIHQAVVQRPLEKNSFGDEKKMQIEEDTLLSKKKVSEIITEQTFERLSQVASPLHIIQTNVPTSAFPIDKILNKPIIFNSDSLNHDTASIKTPATKKLADSKWKFNIVAASGLSGLNNLSFLSVFDGQKSMDASYATSPGTSSGVTYYGPSSIRKGLSFSMGGVVQKELSRRWQISIGLQYNYYSNSIMVGSLVRRDTVFRYAYPVRQYFANNSNAFSYASVPKRYHNHYHFISLPLTMNWQVSEKLPLNFYAGLSIQQMIQTNALVFDYNAQAYYHNNKAFNKTLVFTEYGLNYSIPFGKRYLIVGPEFRYGLSSLETNNPDHHLFSYGLKAQLQLNKK
jgi:hypothetical protein